MVKSTYGHRGGIAQSVERSTYIKPLASLGEIPKVSAAEIKVWDNSKTATVEEQEAQH